MRTSLMSRHPFTWFALGAAVSWDLVLFFAPPSFLWSRAHGPRIGEHVFHGYLLTAFAALNFGTCGSGVRKGRPWPPVALYVPFGLGLLQAAPALLAVAFAPMLATIEPMTVDFAFIAIMMIWIVAQSGAAARLTIRASTSPKTRRCKSQ